MEKTGGFELVTRLKTMPQLNGLIPLLITSYSQIVTSGNMLERGFAGFLAKPFYPDHLKAALQMLWHAHKQGTALPLVTRHYVTRTLHSEEADKPAGPQMFSGTHVLVVEDIKTNLMLITKILEKHGCKVSSAVNGCEALEKLKHNQYDIVFMDCQMPEMDGFEATRLIRIEEVDSKQHTVIIALTADAMSGDREKCLNVGMDDYLNKPLKVQQISSMLAKWVRKAA